MTLVQSKFHTLLLCCLGVLFLLTMYTHRHHLTGLAHAGSNASWGQGGQGHSNTLREKRSKLHCNVYDLSKPNTDVFDCFPLAVKPPVKICVHAVGEDTYIHRSIRNDGLFEPPKVRFVEKLLQTAPEYGLLDIGANIGQYSLIAANMRHLVVSVEPLAANVRRFHKAVQMAGFQDRITLVNNVVSDRREIVRLHPITNNKGGTFVEQNGTLTTYPEKMCTGSCNFTIPSIHLNDLLEVTPFTKCFMKIDIEGFERIAFKMADKLFAKLYIPVVFMEWAFYTKQYYKSGYETDVKSLIAFMVDKGYEPFADNDHAFKTKLDTAGTMFLAWPRDVIWKLKGAKIALKSQ